MNPTQTQARERRRTLNLIAQYLPGTSPGLALAIADRVLANDESIWHAAAQISGRACECYECAPNLRPLPMSGRLS